MREAIQWLRSDIARLTRELKSGACKSKAFTLAELKLQQRRLDFLVETYPEAA